MSESELKDILELAEWVIRLIPWFWQRLPFTAGRVGGQPWVLTYLSFLF